MTIAHPAPSQFHHSLVPAKVTRSYHALGRVKVRYPWMTDQQESEWIAVAAPMAGDRSGAFFMPDEDDQVLVAFSHGHVERSYILGALWSDARKPPDDDRHKRQLTSRSGHTVILDDTKDAEQISIIDSSGKNRIVFDAKNATITIECGGDLTIRSKGNLALRSDKDVTIEGASLVLDAQQKLAAKGKEVAVNGPSGVKINDGALEVM